MFGVAVRVESFAFKSPPDVEAFVHYTIELHYNIRTFSHTLFVSLSVHCASAWMGVHRTLNM